MVKNASAYNRQNNKGTVHRRSRHQLTEDIRQGLRDAVWAGLVHSMHKDKVLMCKQLGHCWVKVSESTYVCERCQLQKLVKEELPESSFT